MKNWIVSYRPRAYRWARQSSITVRADSKKDARVEALMQIGDVYVITKVAEIKIY